VSEKLCIFCKHFRWERESQWGCGSTMTGPMMTGGDAQCAKGHYKDSPFPDDEAAFRAIILRGENCPDYERPATNSQMTTAKT
jgi:hypothetical protein